MSRHSFLDLLFPTRRPSSRPAQRRRHFFEPLEDRRVLATISLGTGGGQAGSLDPSFDTDGWATSHAAQDIAYDVVVDGDGKTVVVGEYCDVSDISFIVARYNVDGSLDTTFSAADGDGFDGMKIIDFGFDNVDTNDAARGVAIDSEGRIVVAGHSNFEVFDDFYEFEIVTTDVAIARLNPDGSFDTTFNGTGKLLWDLEVGGSHSDDVVEDVAVLSDDSIVVVGQTFDIKTNFAFDWHAARVTELGAPDANFGDGGVRTIVFDVVAFETAVGVAVQSIGTDERIVVAGYNDNSADQQEIAVVRLNGDGSDDSTFGVNGRSSVPIAFSQASDVAAQDDGNIFVVGTVHDEEGDDQIVLVSFESDGDLDPGFGTGGIAKLGIAGANLVGADVALEPDGQIVVAGSVLQSATFAVARFDANGTPDSTFGIGGIANENLSGGTERAEAVALDTDTGKIVVAGWQTVPTRMNDLAVARFLPAGGGQLPEFEGFEGEEFPLTGTFSDSEVGSTHSIVIDWGDGTTTTLGPSEIVGGTFSTTHTFADDSDLVTAKIVVTASPSTVIASATADADIDNLPPTATITGPLAGVPTTGLLFTGVRGQPLSFTGTILDPGTLDTHTVTWDFGDPLDTVDVIGLSATHAYAQVGSYSLTLTAVDDDGGSVEVHATVNVVIAQIEPALCGCGTALVIGGTGAAESIAVNSVIGGVQVVIDAVNVGTWNPSHAIEVYGYGGNDVVQIHGTIALTAWLYGGQGHDSLKGGGGHDIILGEQGDDLIVGGSGRDLLIGGIGADRIVGNSDDDILISGTTDHDGNTAALCGILAEWTSSRCDYLRVANIYGCGTGTRLNGNFFLNDGTVHDDGVRDLLTGSSGFDWFFANLSLSGDDSPTKDKITDLSWWEFAKDIDFIES